MSAEYSWVAPHIIHRDGVDPPDDYFTDDPNDQRFIDFQTWVAAGGVPDPMPPQRYLSPGDFLDRFTQQEQLAVQTLANTDAQAALGLTQGTARGVIDLQSQTLTNWVNYLASKGAITPERATVIMTP